MYFDKRVRSSTSRTATILEKTNNNNNDKILRKIDGERENV